MDAKFAKSIMVVPEENSRNQALIRMSANYPQSGSWRGGNESMIVKSKCQSVFFPFVYW